MYKYKKIRYSSLKISKNFKFTNRKGNQITFIFINIILPYVCVSFYFIQWYINGNNSSYHSFYNDYVSGIILSTDKAYSI